MGLSFNLITGYLIYKSFFIHNGVRADSERSAVLYIYTRSIGNFIIHLILCHE